jgi:hypothetical protein
VGFGFGDCVIMVSETRSRSQPQADTGKHRQAQRAAHATPSPPCLISAALATPHHPKQLSCCHDISSVDYSAQELLRELKLVAAPGRTVDYVVAAFNPAMFGEATQVAAALRGTGASVDLLPTHKKAKAAFEYANKVGAKRVAYVAPFEWEKGCVTIKDMLADGEDDSVVKQVRPTAPTYSPYI